MKLQKGVWRSIAIVLVVSLVPFACAWAFWQENGNPVCTAQNDQDEVRISSDGAGGAVLVWEDMRNGGYQIFTQRVDSSGDTLWAENGVRICTARSTQQYPGIVSDGAGGAIITWEDWRGSPINGKNIYVQRVGASGNLVWTPLGVAICAAAGDQVSPQIVPDGQGGAIIVWHDYRNGNASEVYAQLVDFSGAVLWPVDGVPLCTAALVQQRPDIAPDGTGGALVAWEDSRSGASYDIYAQRVNSSGEVSWTVDGVAACTAPDDQWSPKIISDGAGGAIITWYDYRSHYHSDIYAQRVDSSGAVVWPADGAPICTTSYNQWYPEIASDGVGGVIITWYGYRNGTDSDIYAQRADASGGLVWPVGGVPICTTACNQQYPQIISDSAGGAIITWQDERSDSNGDIYAQRVDASGSALWAMDGVLICVAGGEQSYPQIVTDNAGGAIITWPDGRDVDLDIWAQRVGSDGNVIAVYEPGTPSAVSALAQNVPNPFNPVTRVTFSVARPGEVSLRVYDIAGRLIRTLVDSWREPGVYSEVWDGKSAEGSSLPSGIYFYRLEAGDFVAARKMVLLH
jgi:hypothetical protein